jgi:prepilin peptidase CpaA
VFEDLKSYKISNRLLMVGLIMGLLIRFYEFSWEGIITWFIGSIIPIFLLFLVFLLKGLGAGDIKLFSVIGCFYGVPFVLESIVVAFFVGAIMSILYLVKYYLLFYYLKNLFHKIPIYYNGKHSRYKSKKEVPVILYSKPEREKYKGVIHFSVAILTAVIIITMKGV